MRAVLVPQATVGYHGFQGCGKQANDWANDPSRIKDGVKVAADFVYNSNNNSEWMTAAELQNWLDDNNEKIGKI